MADKFFLFHERQIELRFIHDMIGAILILTAIQSRYSSAANVFVYTKIHTNTMSFRKSVIFKVAF